MQRFLSRLEAGTAGGLPDVGDGRASVGHALKDEERRKGVSNVPPGIDAVVIVAGAGMSARGLTRTKMIAMLGDATRLAFHNRSTLYAAKTREST